jgi:indolepyruvate ferredoxin oxidoreductase, alpha subunit
MQNHMKQNGSSNRAESSSSSRKTNEQKPPLMGNEAIARGVWEAGVKVASAYPGTPSTEILENIGEFPESDIEAEWATNEKVAMDIAIGGSFAGVRSFAAMKHVGLNVALDSLMSMTYIGVNGGLVIAVCDDPGIHSSQNEQDTRLLAQLAMIPVLEPSDAQEALEFTRLSFELSEKFDTPVIVRSTTRLSHTRSQVRLGSRQEIEPKQFNEDPTKNVMIPSHARQRHPHLLKREENLMDHFSRDVINRIETGSEEYGIVTSGICYSYVKEVAPEASVLKLGATWPLSNELLKEFCNSVKRVLVVEELEPVIENAIQRLGLAVEGKSLFPRTGEFSPDIVRQGLENAALLPKKKRKEIPVTEVLTRPPVLCAGCPHTSGYMAIRANNARVAGDIGCYTLAAIEPLRSIDTTVAMGSSIGNAVGMWKAGTQTQPIVATIGDSTFLHGGIPPLIDAVYNQADITVVLLDNHTVAMTGGQDNPATGITLRGKETERINLEQLVTAIGVKWVRVVDSYNLGNLYQQMQEAIRFRGVSVVISDRPCVLDPVKIKGPAFVVQAVSCTGCQSCMNLGCPALVWTDEMFEGHHKVDIDGELCMGCSICAQICPTDAIKPDHQVK